MSEALLHLSRFDSHIGLDVLELGDELVRGRVRVEPQLTQPLGMVHGGVYASIAEALASLGTNHGVTGEGLVALGMSNYSTFLRPITEGFVTGTARRCHRGRTTWVWDVELADDAGRLCALSRMTIAVRPMRESSS